MSIVNNVYLDVCAVLLEAAGLRLGLLSPNQFLVAYSAVMTDFLGTTGLIGCIAVMPQQFGISQYTIPDFISEPTVCFSDGLAIRRDFEGNISTIHRNWQTKVGSPHSWRQDKQLPNQLSLFPAPNVESVSAPNYPPPGTYGAVLSWAPGQSETDETAYIGTVTQVGGVATFTSPGTYFGSQPLNQFSRGNVCAIGPVSLLSPSINIGSPIESLTDDWLHIIKYGILEKIWLSDSELKDVQRARYARARYDEGCMLAAAIVGEVIEAE